MASKRTIAGVLAFLHELFPTRDVTEATGTAWAIVFADWTDEDLQTCAQLAAKDPGRKFFPTPGEITEYRKRPPSIDSNAVLDRISALGHHNPRAGWIYPTPEVIRDALGAAVADAYVSAGASQCFATADSTGAAISRDIARRRFADAIEAAHRSAPGGLRLPPPAPEPIRLPDTVDQAPAADLPREIPPGPLSDSLATMTGVPVAPSPTVDEKKVPERPTVTSFCSGCRKLTKVSRYPNPLGGIWWLCQESCAPKPQEIMRAIVENSPPPPDAVRNPAIDQWIQRVIPPDLETDVPEEVINLEIDKQIAAVDAQREGATP